MKNSDEQKNINASSKKNRINTDDSSKEKEKHINFGNELPSVYYGNILHIKHGESSIKFAPTNDMVLDEYGMIHTGFIESAAQFCAMTTVNDPNAIISQTKSEFLAPVKFGMEILFIAKSSYHNLSRRNVKVIGTFNNIIVYEGAIDILLMEKHIFEAAMGKINFNI